MKKGLSTIISSIGGMVVIIYCVGFASGVMTGALFDDYKQNRGTRSKYNQESTYSKETTKE